MNDPKSAPFLVGRIDKRGRRIVFLKDAVRPPFPGPWEVRAVFTL